MVLSEANQLHDVEKTYDFCKLSKDLRADQQVALRAIEEEGGFVLQFAAAALRSDRAFMLQACALDGFVLKYASPPLQADPEVVKTAVLNNGFALKYAASIL